LSIDSRNIFLRVVDREGRSFKDVPPHQIDFYELNFPNIKVKEYTSDILEIVDKSGANLKGLRLWDLYLGYLNFHTSGKITTPAGASEYIELQSHDGSAYVTNLKLVNGFIYLQYVILLSNINMSGYNIDNIGTLNGWEGDKNMYITARRKASYSGDALFIRSYNASDNPTNRIIITGGVDTADIKVGGVEYKIPVYNVS